MPEKGKTESRQEKLKGEETSGKRVGFFPFSNDCSDYRCSLMIPD